MTNDRMQLEPARALVREVLAGDLAPETHASVFDDDVLLLSVATVQRAEPAWLLAQLADTRYPFAGRANVFYALSDQDQRERGLEILRREDPQFLR